MTRYYFACKDIFTPLFTSVSELCYALVRERNCKQFQFGIDAFYEKNHTRNGYGFFGGESEIRTRASGIARTNPLAGDPLIASWVFLQLCANSIEPNYCTTPQTVCQEFLPITADFCIKVQNSIKNGAI